jgi:hypothetical protein
METINSSTNSSINYGLAMSDVDRKCGQAKSGTYAACEQLIQMSFMVMQLATFDHILEEFETSGRLSRQEHQSLLNYARQLWRQKS